MGNQDFCRKDLPSPSQPEWRIAHRASRADPRGTQRLLAGKSPRMGNVPQRLSDGSPTLHHRRVPDAVFVYVESVLGCEANDSQRADGIKATRTDRKIEGDCSAPNSDRFVSESSWIAGGPAMTTDIQAVPRGGANA